MERRAVSGSHPLGLELWKGERSKDWFSKTKPRGLSQEGEKKTRRVQGVRQASQARVSRRWQRSAVPAVAEPS